MEPSLWGRELWISLLNIAEVYPLNPDDITKEQYLKFLVSLSDVLPCFKCRDNYKNHISIYNPDLSSRDSLKKWLHIIYNKTRISQKRNELSYDDFINHFKRTDNKKILIFILFFVIILLLITFFYYKRIFPFQLKK